MRYAKIINGQVTEYPFSPEKLRRENPGTSFPREISDKLFAEYGVMPVKPTPRPEVTELQRSISATPSFIDGEWHQQWTVVPARPAGKINLSIGTR